MIGRAVVEISPPGCPGTLAAGQHPYEQEHIRHFGKKGCSDHGANSYEVVDPDFVAERNGVEWELRDGAILTYCPECVDSQRDYETRDASDEAVLAGVLTSGVRWREAKDLFEPRDLAEGTGLQFCPFCGTELTSANDRNGQVTCPEHGPMNVDVRRHGEVR